MNEIAPIFAQYPPDCRPSVVDFLTNAGGLSGARIWRIVAPRGTLALRCWPIEHPTPERLQFIHAALRHAAARGVAFLPVPLTTTDGATFVNHTGQLWELAPWLPGAADYDHSPRPEKLRAAMTALAQFHVAVSDTDRPSPLGSAGGSSAPAITTRLTRLQELQSGGITTLAHSVNDATWPGLAPLARQIVTELPRVVPAAIARLVPLANTTFPLQVCIRDVRRDHVLFSGDTVTGLIDFGALNVDTPTTDVARLLGSYVGDDVTGWQTGLEAYGAIRPPSEIESQAVSALDTAGTILAAANWIRWIYMDRRRFDKPAKVVERLRTLVSRCQRIR
jgi:homoserine kinase type II